MKAARSSSERYVPDNRFGAGLSPGFKCGIEVRRLVSGLGRGIAIDMVMESIWKDEELEKGWRVQKKTGNKRDQETCSEQRKMGWRVCVWGGTKSG